MAEFANGVLGTGNGWYRPVDPDPVRSEFVLNNGGELFAVGICRKRLLVYEMANDFPLRSAAPSAYLFRRGVEVVMGEHLAQRFGDISPIFDDGAPDIESHEPDTWGRSVARAEHA